MKKIIIVLSLVGFNASAMNLNDAVSYTLENNPSIKAERDNLKAVEAKYYESFSGFMPQAELNYATGRSKFKAGPVASIEGGVQERTAQVTQPIFSAGGTVASVKKSKHNILSEKSFLSKTEQAICLSAIHAYLNVIETKERLKLAGNNLEVLKGHLDSSNAKLKAGLLTRTDIAESEAAVSQARTDRISAEGSYEMAKANFRNIVGVEPEGLVMPTPGEFPKLPETLDDAIAIAGTQNPDISIAIHNYKAAKHGVREAWSAVLPSVNATASLTSSHNGILSPYKNSDTTTALINVNIPIFQGGAEYSRVSQARSYYNQARNIEAATKNQIIESVTSNWANYQSSFSSVKSTADLQSASERVATGMGQEFKVGTRTNLDLLDSLQALYAAKVTHLAARHQYTKSIYSLLVSMGSLNSQSLNLADLKK